AGRRLAGRGNLLHRAAGGEVPPRIDTSKNNSGEQQKRAKNQRCGYPLGRRRDALFGVFRGRRDLRGMRQVVFAQQRLLVQAEIPRDGAHETSIEDAAGKLFPVFIFQRFQKTGTNTSRRSDFLQGHFAQFPLALQPFSEISPGHAFCPQGISVTVLVQGTRIPKWLLGFARLGSRSLALRMEHAAVLFFRSSQLRHYESAKNRLQPLRTPHPGHTPNTATRHPRTLYLATKRSKSMEGLSWELHRKEHGGGGQWRNCLR